jgi:hypothetical protein
MHGSAPRDAADDHHRVHGPPSPSSPVTPSPWLPVSQSVCRQHHRAVSPTRSPPTRRPMEHVHLSEWRRERAQIRPVGRQCRVTVHAATCIREQPLAFQSRALCRFAASTFAHGQNRTVRGHRARRPGGAPLGPACQIRFDVILRPGRVQSRGNPRRRRPRRRHVHPTGRHGLYTGTRHGVRCRQLVQRGRTPAAQIPARPRPQHDGPISRSELHGREQPIAAGSPIVRPARVDHHHEALSTTWLERLRVDYYIYGGTPPYTVQATTAAGDPAAQQPRHA